MIITIGRELGSGGREIGHTVAKKLGYEYFDKELLLEAAKKSGLDPECFERADERAEHNVVTGLFGLRFPFLGDGSTSLVPGFTNDTIFKIQSDVMRSVAENAERGVVFVGRCADYVLRDFPNLLKIFVSAKEKCRVKRIMNYYSCKEEEARDMIRKIDRQRSSYYEYYTSQDWGGARVYDLTVNTSRLGIDTCVNIIINAVKEVENV